MPKLIKSNDDNAPQKPTIVYDPRKLANLQKSMQQPKGSQDSVGAKQALYMILYHAAAKMGLEQPSQLVSLLRDNDDAMYCARSILDARERKDREWSKMMFKELGLHCERIILASQEQAGQ